MPLYATQITQKQGSVLYDLTDAQFEERLQQFLDQLEQENTWAEAICATTSAAKALTA